MSPLTTHVLDTAQGRPAQGISVILERQVGEAFVLAGQGITNADGRVTDLLAPSTLSAGRWRLTFDTGAYFAVHGTKSFYPEVQITFEVTAPGEHHHVPLLLAPYGYSTYRGS